MTLGFKSIVLGLALALLGAAPLGAQDNATATTPSLGQIARQLKAQKAKEAKPAKVITNDTLESTPAQPSPSEKESTVPVPPAEGVSTPPPAHNEEYYRAQMSKLKSHLETDQRELDVLQQKLGQNQMQYYGDPNKSLLQQYSREDVNTLTDEIDAKKAVVASDNQAIDDLRDQLRHEGGDPGWLR